MKRDTDTRIRVCVYIKNNNSLLLAFIASARSHFSRSIRSICSDTTRATNIVYRSIMGAQKQKKKHKNLAHCHPNPNSNQIIPIMLLMFYVTHSLEQLFIALVPIFGSCTFGKLAPQMSRLKLRPSCISNEMNASDFRLKALAVIATLASITSQSNPCNVLNALNHDEIHSLFFLYLQFNSVFMSLPNQDKLILSRTQEEKNELKHN